MKPHVFKEHVSMLRDMANIRTAMNRGAIDFLTKPVDPTDLEITLQKAIRQHITLRQSHQQFRELIEHIEDAVAVVQDGSIVFVNDVLCAIFGQTAEQLRQCAPHTLLKDHDERPAGDGIHAGFSRPWHLEHTTRNGRNIWLESRQKTMYWKGKIARLVIIRDVTAHKVHEILIEREKDRLQKENRAL